MSRGWKAHNGCLQAVSQGNKMQLSPRRQSFRAKETSKATSFPLKTKAPRPHPALRPLRGPRMEAGDKGSCWGMEGSSESKLPTFFTSPLHPWPIGWWDLHVLSASHGNPLWACVGCLPRSLDFLQARQAGKINHYTLDKITRKSKGRRWGQVRNTGQSPSTHLKE